MDINNSAIADKPRFRFVDFPAVRSFVVTMQRNTVQSAYVSF